MDTKLTDKTVKCKPIAKNIFRGDYQPLKPLVLIFGQEYLINSNSFFYEGLSHNEQYHVLRYIDPQLQSRKPLLVPVSDTTPVGAGQYIYTPKKATL